MTDRTHWEGCWREHQACALLKVSELTAELVAARAAPPSEPVITLHVERGKKMRYTFRRDVWGYGNYDLYLAPPDLAAENERHAQGERDAMAVVLSLEGTVERLTAERDALRALLVEAQYFVPSGLLRDRIDAALWPMFLTPDL